MNKKNNNLKKEQKPNISEVVVCEKFFVDIKADETIKPNPNLVTDGELKCGPKYEESSKVLENTRLLHKIDETYKLETFKKNLLYIFNHNEVSGFDRRNGTEHDVTAIKKVFSKFDFEFRLFHDLTEEKIFEELNAMTNEDLSDYGCLGIVVLTHGSVKGKLYAKKSYYSEDKLLWYFDSNCNPSLTTKPKFLIVQACRGSEPSGAIHSRKGILSTDGEMDSVFESYTLPVEADILIFHSTYQGRTSHRVEDHGSWFIQELCKQIDEHADKLDFYSIAVKVKKQVAIDMTGIISNRATNTIKYNKQMPVTISTLIRTFELRKYEDNISEVNKNNKRVTDYVTDTICLKLEINDYKNNEGKCCCTEKNYDFLKHKFNIYLTQSYKDPNHVIGQAIKHGEQNKFNKSVLINMILEEMKNKIVICDICNYQFS